MVLLPRANEVCEDNVFTGVCLSTRGSWSLSRGLSILGEVSIPGESLSRGSLSRGGSLSRAGGSLSRAGGSLSRAGGSPSKGVLRPGGSLSRGLCPGESLSRRVSVQGVLCHGEL